ncbi:MAG: response regulator, partial [Aestuariibacter sp.]|nr:response regulator [Aestuariibacter sp.]
MRTLDMECPYSNNINDDRDHLEKDENSILIIDDDEKFSKILLNIVRSHGLKAIVANDGKNGLYLALEYNPNGIFLDLGLPDMDGEKVLEQLKFHNSTSNIPVHVISGREEDSLLNHDTFSFLKKPAAKEDIDSIINKIGKIGSENMEKALVVDSSKDSQELISKLLKISNIKTK